MALEHFPRSYLHPIPAGDLVAQEHSDVVSSIGIFSRLFYYPAIAVGPMALLTPLATPVPLLQSSEVIHP